MPAAMPVMLDLSGNQISMIDALVRSGRYASRSEVVEAGLQALRDNDAAVDEWLRSEVVPVLKAMQAQPERGVPAKTVFDEIRALHARRLKPTDRAV